MLMPCVLTYTVPPPSPMGQRSQAAASTSAATALVLATLETAFMALRSGTGRGDHGDAPPGSETLVRGDRETGVLEGADGHVRGQGAGDRVGRSRSTAGGARRG